MVYRISGTFPWSLLFPDLSNQFLVAHGTVIRLIASDPKPSAPESHCVHWWPWLTGSWVLSWGYKFGLDVMLPITLGFKTVQEKSLQLEGSSGTISRNTAKYHYVVGRTRKTNSQTEAALVVTPFISIHIAFLICHTETWEQLTCVLPIGEMAAAPPDCTILSVLAPRLSDWRSSYVT